AGLGNAGLIEADWIQNARRTRISIWVDRIRTLIEWRSACVRSRMRQRGVNPELCWPRRSEEHPGKQPTALHTPREVAAARLKASEWNKESVRRDVAVAAEYATKALPEVGDHNDVRLIIARASFDPCLPLAHFIGGAHVRVAISTANFQTAELVDQEEVDYTGDRVGTVHGRGAILEDVHVIN